jgi:cellulose synthase/poly-beta-1,6-N-acetylglucosamine synthase-like glycosyltransferase
MMATLGAWVFWSTTAALFYIYGGFALLLAAVGRLRNRTVRKRPMTPRISMIVAAYNEESQIRRKIENSLDLDYPEDALELIVGSDGSSDATEAIVTGCSDPRVHLYAFPRRGKIHVLNDCVPRACGTILIFSDANTLLDRQALKQLARNFADPAVGGVCGNQVYRKQHGSESSGAGERLYWSYDKWLKAQQTRCGSIVAADGAIYAIRRELYQPPPTAAVTDDFAISTGVVEQGMRLVFESEALAYEPETQRAHEEFGRKVRIVVRGLRGVIMRRRLLNPFRYGFYSLVLFSHKVLRRLAPLFLLGLFASSALLAPSGDLFRVALSGQVAFYLLAGVGYVARGQKIGHSRLLSAPFHYCLVNGAALVALVKLMRGTHIERWQTQRRSTVGEMGIRVGPTD